MVTHHRRPRQQLNSDGRREVLGMEGTSEAEPIWTEFLRKRQGDPV
ncbi:hypothetical protein GOL74_31620 [Sinorhizobium medicae]|nr:hypothetical protein [Sinorhizobium medicae]